MASLNAALTEDMKPYSTADALADAAIEAAEVSSEEEAEVKKKKRKKKKRAKKKDGGANGDSDDEAFEAELAAFVERLDEQKLDYPERLIPNLSEVWIADYVACVKLSNFRRSIDDLPPPKQPEPESSESKPADAS